MLVAYCWLCRYCRNLAEGGCLLSRFHFTRCRYFLGHVACRNLPWQGLLLVSLVNILQMEGRYQLNLVGFYKTLIIGTKVCVVQECPNQAVLTWE